MVAVCAINTNEAEGGAAKAAWRIHHAVRDVGVDSRMWVERSQGTDWTVQSPGGRLSRMSQWAWLRVARVLSRSQKPAVPSFRSLALRPSRWPHRINGSDADVVHLHWTAEEMMSIENIGHIHKPIVWTLHDMWAFCGAEHYTVEDRWKNGYPRSSRMPGDRGIDLDRWVWLRKRRAWSRAIHIVAPSRWLADCARSSALMNGWPVTVIPNAIDVGRWQAIDPGQARKLLGLPPQVKLVAFGAMTGTQDPRKGIDLLTAALQRLDGCRDLELVIFGEGEPRNPPRLGRPHHYLGHLRDEFSLKALYSAVDAVVIPSRQDNLPNVGVEALACGTPVIAFDCCGMPDLVKHRHTGWLAKAFDPGELAHGIEWVLADDGRKAALRANARRDATDRFAHGVVGQQYRDHYESALRAHALRA